jgi:hypothetical protein
LLSAPAAAAPPPNDDFGTAIVLSGDSASAAGTTAEATPEAGEPDLSPGAENASVWYRWDSARSGEVRLSCSSSAPVAIGIFRGTALAALTEVVADEDGCGSPEPLLRANAGIGYWIELDGGDGEGTFSLELENASPAPANDDFAKALAARDLGGNAIVSITTEGAGREAGEPWHGGSASGSSSWFTWTAHRSGLARIYPCEGSFHPLIEAFTGSRVDALTAVGTAGDLGGADPACALAGRGGLTLPAVAGQTYSVSVDGTAGEWGWTDMRILEAPLPPVPPSARIGRRLRIHADRVNIRFYANPPFNGNPPTETTLLCKLDRAAWTACASPKVYRGLKPGRHRFAVVAEDAVAGRGAPTVRHFRIRGSRGGR